MGAITLQTENAIYDIFMQKFHVDSYFQMRLTHVVEVGEGRKGRFKKKKKGEEITKLRPHANHDLP